MPDYKNSRVYKIVSNQIDLIYVGSTTQALSRRMACHRSKYKRWRNNTQNYMTSFEILKHDDAKIILVERVECKDKEELLQIERKYIETLNCCNKNLPGRTAVEWRQDNKEIRNANAKQYYQANETKIKQRFSCECGGRYTRQHKAEHFKTTKHKAYLENQITEQTSV